MKILTLLVVGLSGLALASESPVPAPGPKDLASSDWSGIRALYEAGRHAVRHQEQGILTARNPGQQWRAEFEGRGFTVTPDHKQWTWGLELTGYGESTLGSASSAPRHDGGKITCQRDENLTEWFINDTRGLEQGWTFQQRPQQADASAPLRLYLSVRGNLRPRVSPTATSVFFHRESGGSALTYAGLKAWDVDGKNLLARFELAGENRLHIVVDDQYARYPVTIDPVAQQAYLKASNTGATDAFGRTTAVSGDTVIVGAPGEDSYSTGIDGDQSNNGSSGSGAVYIFTRSEGVWSQQAYLKPSNTGAGDGFGLALSISGDTVVVGAPNEDSNATGIGGIQSNNGSPSAGAAYVFTRIGTVWSQQAYLKASNAQAGDEFGNSVKISGDSLIVGAHSENSDANGVNGDQSDNNARYSGAAYVFMRNENAWTQQAYLKASNSQQDDFFGRSVSISGDTVVVGASGEDGNGALESGATYVFTRSEGIWSQQAYLKASNAGAADWFGESVDVSGDTLVVGAYGEASRAIGIDGDQADNSFYQAGAAYVFERSGGMWSQQAYLKPSAARHDKREFFASSVAVWGNTVVVGATGEDSAATGVNGNQSDNSAADSGAAYVFTRSGSSWVQLAYLKASNTETTDNFGAAVAISGDFILAGAPTESGGSAGIDGDQSTNSSLHSGAGYIFDLAALLPQAEIAIEQYEFNDIGDAGVKSFGVQVTGSSTILPFTMRNTGSLTLSGISLAIDGLDSADFTITQDPASTVAPNSRTSFTIRFSPITGGVKTAALHIASNDADENPFDLNLTSTALAFTSDGDGDGMNDASEFKMATLGFNWQVSQPSLVTTYQANANGAGYYSPSQVQALHSGTPLISRDPASGKFKLTMDWKKSTDLTNFSDFPAPAGSAASISPSGDIDFEFSVPDNAAFFRLEVE